jgi:hypothetical protein
MSCVQKQYTAIAGVNLLPLLLLLLLKFPSSVPFRTGESGIANG